MTSVWMFAIALGCCCSTAGCGAAGVLPGGYCGPLALCGCAVAACICAGATPSVVRFAQAIAFAEGYWNANNQVLCQNRPARNNNPGDFVGTGDAGSSGGYAVFTSPAAGFARLYQQLNLIISGGSAYYSLNMTIAQMAAKWTTTQQAAWAANVAAYLGGTPSDTLAQWLS